MSRLRRWTRPLRHRLASVLLEVLSALLQVLPVSAGGALGAGLGRLSLLFAGRSRRVAQGQLLACGFGPTVVSDHFAELGRRAAELMMGRRLLERGDVVVMPSARAVLDAPSPRPRLVLTFHFGHWELCAAGLARAGYAVHALAAPSKHSPLHRALEHRRRSLGVTTHSKIGSALRHLRSGGMLALLVDLSPRRHRHIVSLLDYTIPASSLALRLLSATGARPICVLTQRGNDGRHLIEAFDLEGAADPLALAYAHLDHALREAPAQWIWIHPREGLPGGSP